MPEELFMTKELFQVVSMMSQWFVSSENSRSVVRSFTINSRIAVSSLLLVLSLIIVPIKSNADIIRKAKLKSDLTEVVLPAESPEQVTFWAEMKGNSSNVVNFRIEAPQGTRVEFSGAQAAGRGRARIESIGKKTWYPVLLKERYKDGAREASEFTLRRNARVMSSVVSRESEAITRVVSTDVTGRLTGSLSLDLCNFLTPEQIQSMLDQLKQFSGREWTKEEFCDYIKNPTEEGSVLPAGPGGSASGGGSSSESPFPTDPTDEAFLANMDNASLDLGGVFRKDSCNSRVSKYIVKVTLDFSGVDITKFPQGITVRFHGLENVYKGKRAASVKPVSDGRFAPAPLLLMTSVSYDEDVEIMKWTKGKPKQVATVDIEDRVYYRGFVLSRSVASSILSGGKASVDKVSDYQSYGACLSMTRTRQRVNGYPGEGS